MAHAWEERGIVIDDYYPDYDNIVWVCDQCGEEYPVTAQFETADLNKGGQLTYVTICPDCLQAALDGIHHALAHPAQTP